MASKKKKSGSGPGILASNRKAFRDYHVMDKLEAGIELCGTEVKSIRQGHLRVDEAYVQIKNGQAELHQMTVQPYEHGNIFNHDPTRPRRLLMHKKEILRLESKISEKGLTLVPLKVYLKNGRVKVEIALCKGKDTVDKRETLKKKSADMEARRAMRRHTM
ncbi:SsrA-binding protein SmpB [Tichowtungia aerotolerans]|uniref:SsrA-binding protein n=1 Tax=Tichowtungia aerotolerans TaxID=2697043 RepID=A0A6P1M852_9BACT|nr:SsrA-binding protein SmpB [Tichowtungia aerotolerans]QHI70222.1 SsrA-binding protein SmpB [Tichowtungia aerotolerans]